MEVLKDFDGSVHLINGNSQRRGGKEPNTQRRDGDEGMVMTARRDMVLKEISSKSRAFIGSTMNVLSIPSGHSWVSG